MADRSPTTLRDAVAADVDAICRFGAAVIPAHYAPLIGKDAADAQVRAWWSSEQISLGVGNGCVVVAETAERLVGVGQRGRYGDDHVVYKLYVHPDHRGHGIGRLMLDRLIAQLPVDADRVYIEHFAANERAGAFYEREGYAVDRVEPSPSGDPALAQVWRVRTIRG